MTFNAVTQPLFRIDLTGKDNQDCVLARRTPIDHFGENFAHYARLSASGRVALYRQGRCCIGDIYANIRAVSKTNKSLAIGCYCLS